MQADSDFIEQVRQTQRAVSAGVETEDVDGLGNVSLRSVVAIAFVEAMGDVEVIDRQRLFPIRGKAMNHQVRDRLLGKEVNRADSQPRVDHPGRADVLHEQRTV
jgi:hypothetical protein